MEIRPPRNRAEHRAALARLIDRSGWAAPEAEERVRTLEEYVAKRGLTLDHCLLAVQADHIEAVCLCLDSPGRTSNILLSPGLTRDSWRPTAVEMVNRGVDEAATRGVQLVQGMVVPEWAEEGLIYSAAGFRHLAQLIYMQANVYADDHAPPHNLTWVTYGSETHAMFARVVEETYQNSLDCGSLNGIRHIEDILASHQATGQFDPQVWQIGMQQNEPVGTVLLGFIEEQPAYELAYMGCLPPWRGRGYGSSLLAQAFSLARARGVVSMNVSVDEKNLPARKLYESFGFREVMRRDVWIRVLF